MYLFQWRHNTSKIMLLSYILPISTCMGYTNTQISGHGGGVRRDRPVPATNHRSRRYQDWTTTTGNTLCCYNNYKLPKTIVDMSIEMPHPKTSALYWTGNGISINRVIDGTTKRQQNNLGHERVNCLKIEKKTNGWHSYSWPSRKSSQWQIHTTKTNWEESRTNKTKSFTDMFATVMW